MKIYVVVREHGNTDRDEDRGAEILGAYFDKAVADDLVLSRELREAALMRAYNEWRRTHLAKFQSITANNPITWGDDYKTAREKEAAHQREFSEWKAATEPPRETYDTFYVEEVDLS